MAVWAQALLATAVLVVAPVDAERVEVAGGAGIAVDLDRVCSGPLALADAIARAAAGPPPRGKPTGAR